MARVIAQYADVYVFRRVASGVEFLLLKRQPASRIGGTWQAVTGTIEPGETAWRAALRELHEETGLRAIAFWQLECVNTFYAAHDDTVSMCPSFAAEVAGDAEVVISEEHTEHRWLPPGAAVEAFIWPGQRRAIREILDEIIVGGAAEPFLRIALPGE
jgi:dATP pyrophosphohydrolase